MAFPGRGSAGLLLLVVVGVLAAADVASATEYRVGDNANWTVPSPANNNVDYDDWVGNRTFKFGDVLAFYYLPTAHDVLLVSDTAYEACDISDDPIQKWQSGQDLVALNRTDTSNYYFICGFTGHCGAGQKFHIAVTGLTGTPPGTNETSPPAPSGTVSTHPLPLAGVILSIAMVCVTTLLM